MVGLIVLSLLSVGDRPDRILDHLLDGIKPVAVELTDSPLQKSLKERFNARLEEVKRIWYMPKLSESAEAPRWPWRLLDAVPRLVEARVALENDPANRVKWYEFGLFAMRFLEWVIGYRVWIGTEPPQLLNLARAARIDAEIDLLKLKESLKGAKP